MLAVKSPEIRVGVISGGALGSAFAKISADMGYPVTMYFHRDEALDKFERTYRSDRLEGIDLPRSIRGTRSLTEVARESSVLFLAVPSEKFPEMVNDLKPDLKPDCDVLIGTKGLAKVKGEYKTMSAVFIRTCNHMDRVAVMGGPNIAEQVANHKETGTVIAAYHEKTAIRLQELFNTKYFRIYTEEEVIPLEVWGALKNIMAFGFGVVKAQQKIGTNTLALYFTRALAEEALIGKYLGVKDTGTQIGLSGAGDFFLSCTGEGTRNTQAGEAFANGLSLRDLRKSKTLFESLRTVSVVADLVKKKNLNAPITLAIHGMLYEGWDKSAWIQLLMDGKPEREQFKKKGLSFRVGRLSMRALHKLGINGY